MIYASQINHKSQIINHNMDKEIFLNVLKERNFDSGRRNGYDGPGI